MSFYSLLCQTCFLMMILCAFVKGWFVNLWEVRPPFLDFAYFVELLLELLSGLPPYAPSSFASGGSGWQILRIYFFLVETDAPAWNWKRIWSTQSIWKSGYYLSLHVTSQGMRIQRSRTHFRKFWRLAVPLAPQFYDKVSKQQRCGIPPTYHIVRSVNYWRILRR